MSEKIPFPLLPPQQGEATEIICTQSLSQRLCWLLLIHQRKTKSGARVLTRTLAAPVSYVSPEASLGQFQAYNRFSSQFHTNSCSFSLNKVRDLTTTAQGIAQGHRTGTHTVEITAMAIGLCTLAAAAAGNL